MTDKEKEKLIVLRALECCKWQYCKCCPYVRMPLEHCLKALAEGALNIIDTERAEAVKMFAERLKNEIISDTAYGCDSSQHSGYYDYTIKIGDIPEYIDNLVKEMGGN